MRLCRTDASRCFLLVWAVVLVYSGPVWAAPGQDWRGLGGGMPLGYYSNDRDAAQRQEFFEAFCNVLRDPGLVYLVAHTRRVREGARLLPHARAALKRDVASWDVGRLQRPLPPPEKNAAPLIAALAERERANPLTEVENAAVDGIPQDPIYAAGVRETLRRRRDLLDLAHQVAERPLCVVEHDWKSYDGAWRAGTAGLSLARRLLRAESALAALDGRFTEAVATQTLCLRLGDHAATAWPGMNGYLYGCAQEGAAIRGLAGILLRAGPDAATGEAIYRVLSRRPTAPRLRRSLAEEAVIACAIFGMMRTDALRRYPGRALELSLLLDGAEAYYLSDMRRLLDAASMPCARRFACFRAVDSSLRKALLGDDITQALRTCAPAPPVSVWDVRCQASAAVTLAAAQVMQFWAAHGVWPTTLAEAVAKPPADPFTGNPLGYRREGDGFVLWSVGLDGKFDGGKPGARIPGDQVGLRYPAPALPVAK